MIAVAEPTPIGEVILGGVLSLWILFGIPNSSNPQNSSPELTNVSPALFDATNAVGSAAWAARMKAMADAQGASLSDPLCPQGRDIRRRGLEAGFKRVSLHFVQRVLERGGYDILDDILLTARAQGRHERYVDQVSGNLINVDARWD